MNGGRGFANGLDYFIFISDKDHVLLDFRKESQDRLLPNRHITLDMEVQELEQIAQGI